MSSSRFLKDGYIQEIRRHLIEGGRVYRVTNELKLSDGRVITMVNIFDRQGPPLIQQLPPPPPPPPPLSSSSPSSPSSKPQSQSQRRLQNGRRSHDANGAASDAKAAGVGASRAGGDRAGTAPAGGAAAWTERRQSVASAPKEQCFFHRGNELNPRNSVSFTEETS